MDSIGHRTLLTLLAERLTVSPAATFVVHEDDAGAVTQLTYAAFVDGVTRLARGLGRLGVGRETKACVHMTNRPEFLIAWLALGACRAVMVPSNIWNSAREMEYVLERSDAEWIVTEPAFAAFLRDEVLPRCPRVRGVIVAGGTDSAGLVRLAELMDEPDSLDRYRAEPSDILQMIFTSGTTAQPKAVMLTHANALWSGIETSKHLLLTPADRNLTSLPLFHVNAQGVALGSLTVGAALVLLQRYSATRYMAQVRHHRATTISMVPALLRTVMAQPASPEDRQHDVRLVKYAINVSDEEKHAFEARFGLRLLNGYGLTEAYVSVAGAPQFGDPRWPSVGLPIVGREVRIVDERAGEVPAGTIGEITVRGVPGRTIMLGYYKDPLATAETIRDGWLHTGDLGWIDGLGYLHFHGRQKDMIKRGGENVSAAEVELVLASHPAVQDAAVIGVPDAVHDEAVKAFIVLRDGVHATDAEILAFCQARLAKFKVPSRIEFRDALPKTSIGKIEKKQLREEART